MNLFSRLEFDAAGEPDQAMAESDYRLNPDWIR
jgi:hypothetical protein